MSHPLTLRTEAGDELVELEEFEARARRGELSPQCLVCFPAVTGDHFVPACELQIFKALHQPRRAYFARAFALDRFPWITSTLILVNLCVYVISVEDGPLDLDGMVHFGAKVRPLIIDLGEIWRLLSANFLHRDALHIGLNMFVLFNVGGLLENAYRPLDYLWLLLFTGLVTMAVSLGLSDAVSLGASGMVFGCLGGVVVFGLKYRSILPSFYRRILSEAAIPTVLVFMWIGLTSVGVDNAAHAGGLIAGVLSAPFLRPKLLADAPSRWSPALRALPSALVLAFVVLGQPVLGSHLPITVTQRDDEYGLSVPMPRGWWKGTDKVGQLAFHNGLPGLGRAAFYGGAVFLDGPPDVAEQAKRYIDEGLIPSALGPEVLAVRRDAPKAATVGEHQALMVRASYDEPSGKTELVAYFVPRGELVYQLVFTYPADYRRYAKVVDRMVAATKLEEPRLLREARARALLFPHSSLSQARLGESLRSFGEPSAAAEALRAAVNAEPASPLYRTQLALSLLEAGQVDEACESSRAAVLYAPQDPGALEADARCELAKGNPAQALRRLQQARGALPQDARLKRVERALQAAVDRGAAEQERTKQRR
ncbi:MAG: rhomboid family intramembrane serine protease [Myxococcaceae bacterium]